MKPLSLHHVNVVVRDLDEAATFYTEVLGFDVLDDRAPGSSRGAHFVNGPVQVHVTLGEPLPERGQHFALVVEDLDELARELSAAGVEVPVRSDRRLVTLRDPSGNRIEIRDAQQA